MRSTSDVIPARPVRARQRALRWSLPIVATVATLGCALPAAASAPPPAGPSEPPPAAAAPQRPSYVALGDSYSSGVGTRVYYQASGNCKRSGFAYGPRVAATLNYHLTFAACSGATTGDVLSRQVGLVGAPTRYVTISVGGNDANFANVLVQCAKPWPTTCWGDIKKAEAFIRSTLPGRLDQVYSTIRARAPHATVVVVGYPRLFNGKTCNGGSRISSGEEKRLNQTGDLLDDITAGRAAAHGFRFVDPRGPFTGHAVCDHVEWLNGLSNPYTESYHPNVAGQGAYWQLVTRVLR